MRLRRGASGGVKLAGWRALGLQWCGSAAAPRALRTRRNAGTTTDRCTRRRVRAATGKEDMGVSELTECQEGTRHVLPLWRRRNARDVGDFLALQGVQVLAVHVVAAAREGTEEVVQLAVGAELHTAGEMRARGNRRGNNNYESPCQQNRNHLHRPSRTPCTGTPFPNFAGTKQTLSFIVGSQPTHPRIKSMHPTWLP